MERTKLLASRRCFDEECLATVALLSEEGHFSHRRIGIFVWNGPWRGLACAGFGEQPRESLSMTFPPVDYDDESYEELEDEIAREVLRQRALRECSSARERRR